MTSIKKFRAWLKPRWDGDHDANKMYYDIQNSYDRMGHVTIGTKQKGEIKLVTVLDPMESFAQWLDEDAAIVEQFTGLLDRNGKEIYEGDIVEGDMGVFEVKWYDLVAQFMFTPNTDMKWHPPFVCDQVKEMKVIGNIHENKEWLGGEE